MRILIIGNLGYIGPLVVEHFRKLYNVDIFGLDTGYFSHTLSTNSVHPEFGLKAQVYKDVRNLERSDFTDINVVVYLAAISNDPMGNEFEEVTLEVNRNCALKAAEFAKMSGASSFVFASSCSVYGTTAEAGPKNENSELNPLTAYALSKIGAEKDLQLLASKDFKVTCLRFATACGFSPRIRLDLVLNDFVASALVNGKIEILSDGTPWRPLIHVKDMARAIEWAAFREVGNNFLAINTGSNSWNYQVKELALAVANLIPGVDVSINQQAAPDKRSYQVDFSLFEKLAPKHQPQISLEDAILDIAKGLQAIGFNDSQFRDSLLIRLNVLRTHINQQRLNKNLFWN